MHPMGGMTDNVRAHYTGEGGSNLAGRVRALLETLGPGRISPEHLAALDHFHVRGAEATAELAKLAGVQAGWKVLDAGSGLGGPSRQLAKLYGCHVKGIDLTLAFVEVAELLAEQALAARTKYVRIIRREIKGRVRWFCQLVQESLPPATHTTKDGTVGLDIGPSSIAAVSSDDAILQQLCPSVVEPWNDCRARWTARDVQPTWTTSMPKGARSALAQAILTWGMSSKFGFSHGEVQNSKSVPFTTFSFARSLRNASTPPNKTSAIESGTR